jgi:hypothetical protein
MRRSFRSYYDLNIEVLDYPFLHILLVKQVVNGNSGLRGRANRQVFSIMQNMLAEEGMEKILPF